MSYPIKDRVFFVKNHLKSNRSLRQSAKLFKISRHALTMWVEAYKAGEYQPKPPAQFTELTIDFEISPMLADTAIWSLWQQNIPEEDVYLTQRIVAFSVFNKRTGECFGKHLMDYEGYADDPSNDGAICKEISELINSADSVLGHNVNNFDMKQIRTRMLDNGLPPLKPVHTADTLKEARKYFRFGSNKLNHLAAQLENIRKKKLELKPILVAAVKGTVTREQLDQLVEYGVQDAICSNAIENVIAPWSEGRLNRNLFREGDEVRCPNCSSSNVQAMEGHFKYTKVSKQQLFQCNDCGRWATDGVNLIKKDTHGLTVR